MLIVGLGATATDMARGLAGIAKDIFISHRNGCVVVNTLLFSPIIRSLTICVAAIQQRKRSLFSISS